MGCPGSSPPRTRARGPHTAPGSALACLSTRHSGSKEPLSGIIKSREPTSRSLDVDKFGARSKRPPVNRGSTPGHVHRGRCDLDPSKDQGGDCAGGGDCRPRTRADTRIRGTVIPCQAFNLCGWIPEDPVVIWVRGKRSVRRRQLPPPQKNDRAG